MMISFPGSALSVVSLPFSWVAMIGRKLITLPLLVSNSTEAPAYHLDRRDEDGEV